MPSPSKRVFFADCIFDVGENVYEPAEDSFLFAENLSARRGDCVLDMGTGCGMLGTVAAKQGARVVAIDINPYAVRCARDNARLNRVVDRMFVVQGDLFSPLKRDERFDVILFNAPYLPAEHREGDSWLERAWVGGVTGRQVINRFIREAPKHLRRRGHVLMMQSNLAGLDETLQAFEEKGLRASILIKRDLPLFESLALVRANSSG
jgi:release factor glutamine methyltransferase